MPRVTATVLVFPEAQLVKGKYQPGPGIHIVIRPRHRALTLKEAKRVRRLLGYLIKLVEKGQP